MMGQGRTAIIVAGMHRSGTSMATRIINLLGAGLADQLVPAGVGNERGHWESRAVQDLHNRLLAELGSDVYSPVSFSAAWFDSVAAQSWVGRIQQLLADEYATSPLFVMKDPRISLFLPLWIQALRKVGIAARFVLPFRHPDAVARSLQERESRLGSGNALPLAQGRALWLRYVLAAERFTRGETRSFIAFDQLLVDWRTQFGRMGRQLGIEWPAWQRAQREIDEFLDVGGRGTIAHSGRELSGPYAAVYASLGQAVLEPQTMVSAFDTAAQALADAENLLGSHIVARERVFDDLRKRTDIALRQHDTERAQMHDRFASEIALRDARITEAGAHARGMAQTLEMLERERSKAVDYARSLERDRDRAVEHASALTRNRDEALARGEDIEKTDLHDRFAAEVGLRDARLADATDYARAMEEAVDRLKQERGNALDYARSLELERERATEYAQSLQRSRDEAVQYAQSLEQARGASLQSSPPHARRDPPVFFTIASRNYLAYVITLMQSVAQQYPDALRYLILADRDAGDPALAGAPFSTIPATALALPDFESFAFRYNIMEFNTAIKPYAFAHLRRLHPGAGVVYLDPDILVLEPLAKVEDALADGALMVLTPHLLQPIDDDHLPGEREILVSGTYNCGFVAIGAHAAADRLIDWWSARLEFGAFSDVTSGLFTDQKWIDLVPGLFADVHILRDEGYNLAYWNLSQRPVSRQGSHWYASGRPLAFVHFSGADVDYPAQFSRHQNRHTRATIGELRPLFAEYLACLSANGHAEHRNKPYAFARFADGEPICDAVRVAFRRNFDKRGKHAQANPYSMDRKLFDLPCEELPERADAPVTRLMYATWQMREDLRRAFDVNQAAGREAFVRWFASTAGPEMRIPERHLDAARRGLLERAAEPDTRTSALHRAHYGAPGCDAVRLVYQRYAAAPTAQAQNDAYSKTPGLCDLPCEELPVRADAPMTRLMYVAWQMREDLRAAFDVTTTEGREGFMRWFVGTAGPEMGVPERHLEPARRALVARKEPMRHTGSLALRAINWSCRFPLALRMYGLIPQALRQRVRDRLERNTFAAKAAAITSTQRLHCPAGINLVGYAHGEFGVAEILRRYAHTLQDGNVPFLVRNFDIGVASRLGDRSMEPLLSAHCRYDVNLFCINADQMHVARRYLGDAVFGGRYNIGCWFWELERFPEQWHASIDLVDEIWVTSPFVRDAIAACTSKPVRIVPIALGVDLPRRFARAEVGLPDDAFVCLFSFDFNSFVVRKNAHGAIAAFRKAFADGRSNVRLLIKTTNGERFPDALRALIDAAAVDDRIEVRDGFLDRTGMWALQSCCDCYVSLHRSEGLGLGMAECMLLGKPVVATAYSGNLAFMDVDNSCLVGYSLVAVKEGEYPAWEGQHWAEPDVDQAAEYLRRLADDPDYAREVGARASASVSKRLSVQASLAAITARLAQIRGTTPSLQAAD